VRVITINDVGGKLTIMATQDLLRNLEDYFLGRGRFDRSEYYGMRGSQIAWLLVGYYEELDAADRSELTHLLIEVIAGDRKELSAHTHLAIHALVFMAAKGDLNPVQEDVAWLEREFSDPTNIHSWSNADEMTEPIGGPDFKRTWHYAASLSFILKLLKSEPSEKTRQFLLTHSRSVDFKETLQRH
jgi:hypothetical protein